MKFNIKTQDKLPKPPMANSLPFSHQKHSDNRMLNRLLQNYKTKVFQMPHYLSTKVNIPSITQIRSAHIMSRVGAAIEERDIVPIRPYIDKTAYHFPLFMITCLLHTCAFIIYQ